MVSAFSSVLFIDFLQVPGSVLDALEQHLAHLEGKKLNDRLVRCSYTTYYRF